MKNIGIASEKLYRNTLKTDIVTPSKALFSDGLLEILQIIDDMLIQTNLIFERHRCRRMSLGKQLLSAHLP